MDELKEIGLQDVALTDYGAVLATIPASVQVPAPTIALLAHVDTAPQFPGKDVKPIVHRGYSGEDIVLPDDPSKVLSPTALPYLGKKVGDDIVTASGKTLLGADDKAGVAIIMVVARHLMQNPGLPHGPIRIGFTPDEEIGRGVHAALPGALKADLAYTLDGAHLGEIVYETFSADAAKVNVKGVAIHPGWAKDKLVNATHLAAKIVDTLPQATLTPETTAGRQGFMHVVGMSGSAAEMNIDIILRDFEREGLAAQGALLEKVCAAIQAGEPRAQHHVCDHAAVPQHALLAGRRYAAGRAGAGGGPPDRRRAVFGAHPRRYRRLPADGAGPADAQRVHRHAGNPRAARMGQPAGHGARERGVHQAGAAVGGGRAARGETGTAARSRRPIRGRPSTGRMTSSALMSAPGSAGGLVVPREA